jgi:hypothetical protein
MAQGDRLVTVFDNEVDAQVSVLEADRIQGDSEVGNLLTDLKTQELNTLESAVGTTETNFDNEKLGFGTVNGPGFDFSNSPEQFDIFPNLVKNEVTQKKPRDFVSLINSVVDGTKGLDAVLQIVVNGGTDLINEVDALEGQLVTLTSDIDALLVGSDTTDNSFKKLVDLVEAAQGGTFAQWMIDNTKRVDDLSEKQQTIDTKRCYKDVVTNKFYKIVMSNNKLILIETLPSGTIVLTVLTHVSYDLIGARDYDTGHSDANFKNVSIAYQRNNIKSQIQQNDSNLFFKDADAAFEGDETHENSRIAPNTLFANNLTKETSSDYVIREHIGSFPDATNKICGSIQVYPSIAPFTKLQTIVPPKMNYVFDDKPMLVTNKYLFSVAEYRKESPIICGVSLDHLSKGVIGYSEDISKDFSFGTCMAYNEHINRLYIGSPTANSKSGRVSAYDIETYSTSEEDEEGDTVTIQHMRFSLAHILSQDILNAYEGSSVAILKETNDVYVLSKDETNGQIKVYNVNGIIIKTKTLDINIDSNTKIFIEYNPKTKKEEIIIVMTNHVYFYDLNFILLGSLDSTSIKYAGLTEKGFIFNVVSSGISVINFDHLLVLDNYPVLETNEKFNDLITYNNKIIGSKLLKITSDNQHDREIENELITHTNLGDLKTY